MIVPFPDTLVTVWIVAPRGRLFCGSTVFPPAPKVLARLRHVTQGRATLNAAL
jgi:hypothetical protein